jgi:polyisoprenyl-phosphate glycosyltransferase
MTARSNACTCEISVIAPLYKGETFVTELVSRIIAALTPITPDFEVILIDDGSPDLAWKMIENAARQDPRVKGLRFSRNFGQHPALTAGIDHSSGRWVVVMDGDLQDRPEDIPKLYDKAVNGPFDIVIARRSEQTISLKKRIPSLIFNWVLAWLGDIDTNQAIGNFRIFSRKVAVSFHLYREQFRLLPALMARLGFDVGYVNVNRPAAVNGKTTYTFGMLVRLATDAIIANSEKPLWIGITLGVLTSILGFVLAVWALVARLLTNQSINGWTSLFIAITFFSGIQLMFAGLVGVYVGRVYNETKCRPLYIVRESLNMESSAHLAGRASNASAPGLNDELGSDLLGIRRNIEAVMAPK